MFRAISVNQAITPIKEYATLTFNVKENGSLVFNIKTEKGLKSEVTFNKTSDQSNAINSWLENMECKYNLIRNW